MRLPNPAFPCQRASDPAAFGNRGGLSAINSASVEFSCLDSCRACQHGSQFDRGMAGKPGHLNAGCSPTKPIHQTPTT